MAKRRKTKPYKWGPMKPAHPVPHTQDQINDLVEKTGRSEQEIRKDLDADLEGEFFMNKKYVAILFKSENGKTFHISYRRLDRKPARDWRDTQNIKNDLAGPEAEALELYPSESRLVDTANQFHLWGTFNGKIPVGFDQGREVSDTEAGGSKQRNRS